MAALLAIKASGSLQFWDTIVALKEVMLSSSGSRWWIKAEKPWQCLAACMEVRDALASGNPAAFPSRLPVQMDGSCNGLQHYAALGRDADGGNAVNLRPNPAPQVRSY